MIFLPLSMSTLGLTGRSSNHQRLDNEDKRLLDARFRGHEEASFESQLRRIRQAFGMGARLYLAASHAYRGDDRARIEALAQLAGREGLALVATNAVLYHAPHRSALAGRAHLHSREMHDFARRAYVSKPMPSAT